MRLYEFIEEVHTQLPTQSAVKTTHGVEEAEGDAEGVPHITKQLLKNIVKQVETEGAHAIVKSLEWGDGAAKELLQLFVRCLKKEIDLMESVKQSLDITAAGLDEAKKGCPPATQDIDLNLENRQKAIDERGYGPLNPDLPNKKFWMKKVVEWNLDSAEEAKQSLCGNCAAFDQRKATLDCIAQGIDSESPSDAEGVIDAGDLGYCKFLEFKCASRRTCDAWVTGGPLIDKAKKTSNLSKR